MKTALPHTLAALVAGALSAICQDNPPPPPADGLKPPAEAAAVAEATAAYAACYNRGDAGALAALFAADAEWVDDEGNVIAGRSAIESMLAGVFRGSKGRTLNVRADSVRKITADVLSVKGTAVITEADGEQAVGSYTAVYVRQEGRWLVSQFTETGVPFAGNARTHLAVLGGLVGSWKAEADGFTIRNKIEWAAGGNFLSRTFSIKAGDGAVEREGTEVIGWDAREGRIRSWVFESNGSFSERFWTQDDGSFLIKGRTILPDGGIGSEEITLRLLGRDKISWSAASRIVDGEALPNIDPVTSVRE